MSNLSLGLEKGVSGMFWVVDMILPVTMVIISFYYKKKAYSKMTNMSGFRTAESMKNKECWKEAHLLASKLLFRAGVILIVIVLLLKGVLPLEPPHVSLINNGISLVSYIVITMYVNNVITRK